MLKTPGGEKGGGEGRGTAQAGELVALPQ